MLYVYLVCGIVSFIGVLCCAYSVGNACGYNFLARDAIKKGSARYEPNDIGDPVLHWNLFDTCDKTLQYERCGNYSNVNEPE